MRSGLAADAAADVRLARKKFTEARLGPRVRDGIAHEDDARFFFGGRGEFRVRFAIAREIGPIFENGIHARDS